MYINMLLYTGGNKLSFQNHVTYCIIFFDLALMNNPINSAKYDRSAVVNLFDCKIDDTGSNLEINKKKSRNMNGFLGLQ